MSSASESDESENQDIQLAFILMLEEFPIILNKSMAPAIREEKDQALKMLTNNYNTNNNKNLTTKQVLKKINNIKGRIKKKTDLKKTGNKKINLNEWQRRFYNLWNQSGDNPVLEKVPGAVTAGTSQSDASTSRKRRFEETDLENEPALESVEDLQKTLIINQINAAKALENAAIAQKNAANAQESAAKVIEVAVKALEALINHYYAKEHDQ